MVQPDMESLGSVVFSLFRGSPRHGEWVVSCLAGAWPVLVGQQISAACEPRSLEKSILTVQVIVPEWKEALEGLKEEIAAKLRTATGGVVEGVVFSMRESAAPSGRDTCATDGPGGAEETSRG